MTTQRLPLGTLEDYVLMMATRCPELMEEDLKPVTLNNLVRDDALVVETEGQARLSMMLAEALLQMSEDLHEPGDRASTDGGVTKEYAAVLVEEYDGIRPAARATGIPKTTLWRALKGEAV